MITLLKWLSAITWELPQTLVGFLMWCYFMISGKGDRSTVKDCRIITMMVFTKWDNSSDSLGHFVFFNKTNYDAYVRRHELGHSLQSYMLGPLYLFIISLPSLFNWCMCTFGKRSWDKYYTYYPENWANKLGGNKK